MLHYGTMICLKKHEGHVMSQRRLPSPAWPSPLQLRRGRLGPPRYWKPSTFEIPCYPP